MDWKNATMGNIQTSAVGVAIGALNQFGNGSGFAVPANKNEWIAFAISVCSALLGLLAKDAAVGSKADDVIGTPISLSDRPKP